MSWDAVGALAEILGSLAVLLTLVFLARQIREGNKVSLAATGHQMMQEYARLNDMILTTPALADLLGKMRGGACELTLGERVQLEHYCYRYMDIFSSATAAYDHGQLDEVTYGIIKIDTEAILQVYPGLAEFFRTVYDRLEPGVREIELLRILRDGMERVEAARGPG